MAWIPTAKVRTPGLKVLPQDLRALLEQRFRTAIARTTLDIGAHVEEMVTVSGGHIWRHEAKLMPGQTDARRFDSVTQLVRGDGVIDREGHFGITGTQCPYCGERVCEICASGMVACDCCGTRICKRCVRELRTDVRCARPAPRCVRQRAAKLANTGDGCRLAACSSELTSSTWSWSSRPRKGGSSRPMAKSMRSRARRFPSS